MEAINGIIIIDKPSGFTSHDVVAKLRGILKTKRIGHGGTLDPIATGVLPIFIGRATRAVEFCESFDKEYIAGIQFGITTDTQDITGTILNVCEATITAEELEAISPQFLYAQKQVPPMYSAIKIKGKKLYELARKGIEIKRPARDIYISKLEILSFNDADKAQFVITCSKGTYIRTLCHDIGQVLGCGAVMSELRRTRVGNFTLSKAHTLEDVTESVCKKDIDKIIIPTETLFENYPIIKLNEIDTKKCKNGAICYIEGIMDGKYRTYSTTGEFLAFSEAQNNKLKTIKSFFIL